MTADPQRLLPTDLPSETLLPLLGAAGFISLMLTRLCDAMLPALAEDFGTTTLEASAVISAYAIAYGLMQLVYGPLGDRYGKLRVIALTCAACSIATGSAAMVQSLDALVFARIAMGSTAAAIFPMGLAWISDTVAATQRQQVLARFAGMTVFGLVLGPMLGGLMSQVWNWRAAFVAVAILLATTGLLVWRQAASETVVSDHFKSDAFPLYAKPWARIILGAVCLETALGIGCLALVPTVLYQHFGLSLTHAGAVVATFGMGGFLFSRSAPLMLRWVPRPMLPALGGLICAVALASLAFMLHWGWTVLACAIAGFGFFTLHNTLQLHATLLAPTATGMAFAVFTSAIFIGQSVGVTMAAYANAKLGPAWVFAGAAGCFLVLGAAMTALLLRRS